MTGTCATGVALLAKTPAPGRAKTRLSPPLSPQEAASVARACLTATVESLVPAACVSWTIFLDGPEERWVAALAAAHGMRTARQTAGDLGARIRAAFRVLRSAGATRVIAVGADSPTLPPARITEAVLALASSDVVLGPTEDGGYYLVGTRVGDEAIFRDIPWSTGEVLSVTLERAEAAGLSVRLLPAWYDIDDPGDLKRLSDEVRNAGNAAGGLGELLDSLREKLWRESV